MFTTQSILYRKWTIRNIHVKFITTMSDAPARGTVCICIINWNVFDFVLYVLFADRYMNLHTVCSLCGSSQMIGLCLSISIDCMQHLNRRSFRCFELFNVRCSIKRLICTTLEKAKIKMKCSAWKVLFES